MTNEELRRINEKYGIKNTQPQNIVSAAPSYYADHIAEKVSAINAKYGVPDTNIREVLKESYKRKSYSESSLNLPASGDYMGKPFSYAQALKEYKERKLNAQSGSLKPVQAQEPKTVLSDNKPFIKNSLDSISNTVLGGAKNSAASYTNLLGTFYEAGQGGRTSEYMQQREIAAQELERWEKAYQEELTAGTVKPGDSYYENMIADAKRKYDAYNTVLSEKVQENATKGVYDIADNIADSAAKNIQKAKETTPLPGILGDIAVDAGASMTQMGIDAAANFALGGAAASGYSAARTMVPFAARAFGSGTQKARRDGAKLKDQLMYGAAIAAKEVMTEKMFNIAAPFKKVYGEGTMDDIMKGAIDKVVGKLIKNGAGRKIVTQLASGALGEGLEEFIGDWLEWQMPRIYNGDVDSAADTLSQSLYNFAVGAASGFVGDASAQLINGAVEHGTNKFNPESIPEPLKNGKNTTKIKYNGPIALNMEASSEVLTKMNPVSTITGNEFAKSDISIIESVSLFFKTLGNKVNRSGFGDVVLTKRGIKDSIAHGLGREKAAAFAAVPDVIKYGQEIDFKDNWKNRGYDTYMFAAPIEYGAERKYVGVIVKHDSKSNRFYLHEVVSDLKNDTDVLFKTGTVNNGFPGNTSMSFKDNIAQSDIYSNTLSDDTYVALQDNSINRATADAMTDLGIKPVMTRIKEAEADNTGYSLYAFGTNNPDKQELYRRAVKIADNFGAKLKVTQLASGADGEYSNGIISIDPRTKNPIMQVFVHELTHHMETSGQYKKFSQSVLNYIANDMGANISSMRQAVIKEYAKGGFILDEAGADRELVAKFCESKLFQDEKAINRLCRTDRTVFQSIYDWISDTINMVKGTPEEKFLIKAQRIYEQALRSVNNGESVYSNNPQYAINDSLSVDLQLVLDNTFKSKDSEIDIGTTSDFLKTVIGIKDLKVLMPFEKAYASMVSKEQALRENRFNSKLNYHNLGKQGLIDALNSAETPLFAYTPFDNRIVLVTDRVDSDGAPIVLVADLESYGQMGGKTIKANKDITVYGRNRVSDDINDALRENRILYATKKGSQMLSGLTRGQFPSNLDAIDFKNNINTFLWKVNHKNGASLSSKEETSKTAMQRAFEEAQKLNLSDNSYGRSFDELYNDVTNKTPAKTHIGSDPSTWPKLTYEEARLKTAEELIAERRKKEANRSEIAAEKQSKTDGISLVKQSRQDFKRELNELFTIPQHLRGKANREIDRFINKMIAAGAATETDRQEMLAMLYDSGAFLKSSDNDYKAFEDSFDLVLGKFASKARLEMELRRAASKELLTEREKWKNSAKRRRECQELSKRNKQTQRDIKMLRKRIGQNDATLAAAMEKLSPEDRKIAENAIRNISVDAFSLTERAKAKMIENKELYKQQLASDPNYIPSKMTLDTLEKMDQQYLADKTIADLSEIHRAITTLRTHIDNMNQEIGEARYREISDIYSKVKNEIESTKGRGKDVSAMSKFFNEEQLTPMNFLEMLSGWDKDSVWFDTVARQLEEGERKMKQVKVDAARILKDFKEKHSKWIEKSDGQGKNGIWYEIEVPELLEYGKGHKPLFGETTKVYLTPAMKVELSRGIRNNDNLRHAEGGVKFPDKELYSKGKRLEAYEKGTTVKLAPETMKALFAYKNLTPEEQALYDVMDQFFDGYAKSRINETSQIADGIDRAMSRFYSRIYTDENYRNNKMTIDQSIGGMGSLQGREYSKVPIYAMSVWEAFDDTVDTVSKYYGMHIPVKNVSNLMNFIEQENENSMRNVIASKWGPSSKKYIDSLITELSNKHYEEKSVAQLFFDKTLGNYVGATFAFNPGIVLKQAASYPAAAAVLGWGNVPSPMQIKNVDPELILKYTPELEYRSLGYATPEIAELKNNPNILQKNKVTRFFDGGAILAMDRFTVKSIWPWAENYVKAEYKTLKPGTDEFYKKTAEVFNDTIGLTQPMYDVMHRAKIMRGQNAALRALTMFKTVPVQQANMMRQAIGEYARAKTRTKKQKAWKKVITTTTSIVVATVLLESIEFGNNLFKNAAKKYRDDDDKLTAESISAEVGKKIAKDLVGNVIGGDEVVVLMERASRNNYYNGIETPGLSQALDMGESVMKSLKLTMDTIRDINELSDNGGDTKQYFKEHGKDLLGSVKNLASDISTYSFGIPVSNIEKYLLGAMYWTDPKLKEKYLTLWENTRKRDLSGLKGAALKVRVGEYIDLRADGITDKSKKELARLYESQGVEVIPSDVPTKLTVNGKEVELTRTMEQKYRNTYAYIVNSCLNDLLSHKDYLALNDQDKATAITVLYSYAKAAAESASVGKPVTKNLKSFKAVKASGINPVDYVLFMTKTKNITGDKGMRVNHTRKDKIMWIIDDMELSDDQKDALYLASGYVESRLKEAPWRRIRRLSRFDIPKFELPKIKPPSFDYPKY